MKKHYPVIIEQDKDGVYIVECPVLKSCRSYGRTISEAIENIQEAIGACLLDEPPIKIVVHRDSGPHAWISRVFQPDVRLFHDRATPGSDRYL